MYKFTNDIRQDFLNFFKKKEHQIVSSSTLVPDNDQTLLFTNSGMNQFKNIFLGVEQPIFKRVATVQRCVRAGGKHNDLDNVGYTDRHLTFFEMLGNFSFGDYFKYEAIQFAWELLTDKNWFNLSKSKLWATVHICDDESYNIWKKQVDIPTTHIVRIGNNMDDFCDSDNFWKMGNIGPCGPCSEIFYDRGDQLQGAPPGSGQECGERYIEIWNLVFMQFNRQRDGSFLSLPMLSVDTGMGLERIAAILQGVDSSYAVDIFDNLISSIFKIVKVSSSISITANKSVYVIADHIRACVFLIQDGVLPANEGRGYVLRRIIRRAVLHGKKLGMNDAFFYKLVSPLIKSMHYMFSELCDKKEFIKKILFSEEKLFHSTLNRGLELLEKQLEKLKGNVLNGEVAFCLYDTYGFPLEITKDICLQRNICIDQLGFDRAMLTQKKYAKESNKFNMVYETNSIYDNLSSIFVGYYQFVCKAQIIALFQGNKSVNRVCENEEGIVVLDNSPFYGESGGQIGDIGKLKTMDGFFNVMNTKKYGQAIGHVGIVNSGTICVGEEVVAQINQYKRKNISCNHSATHLLHAALCQVLGNHIIQKGSLVSDKYLRFDFYHYETITELQINTVENLVNQKIWANLSITDKLVPIEIARNDKKVVMFVDKQYNKTVRILRIGNFSTELCGGTHVTRTGEIGIFVITKVFSIASGIKRIEAVTNNVALSMIHQHKTLLKNIFQEMQSDDKNVLSQLHEFKLRFRKLEKEVHRLSNIQNVQQSSSLMKSIYYIKDIQILMQRVVNIAPKVLLSMIDYLKNQLKSGVVILININKNNKTHLVIAVTNDLITSNRVNALDLIHFIINTFGGRGGGKSNIAQVGINKIVNTSSVFIAVESLLCKIL